LIETDPKKEVKHESLTLTEGKEKKKLGSLGRRARGGKDR